MNFYLLISLAALFAVSSSKPALDSPLLGCDNGWTQYKDSCFWIEREEKVSFQQAEQRCQDKDAKMYVPNSLGEYNAIVLSAPLNYWTWLGLYKEDETSPEVWQGEAGIPYADLDWLIRPYGNSLNGWTSISQCAAHWNPTVPAARYSYWYPCNYNFFYICERNSTLSS